MIIIANSRGRLLFKMNAVNIETDDNKTKEGGGGGGGGVLFEV